MKRCLWLWSLCLLLPALVVAQSQNRELRVIGLDDVIPQNTYSKAAKVTDTRSPGEFLGITLRSIAATTILSPSGTLLVFKADPGIVLPNTAITEAARLNVVCQVPVSVADWQSDANGASAYLTSPPCVFPAVKDVYVVWFQSDAVGWNAAAEDQQLRILVQW